MTDSEEIRNEAQAWGADVLLSSPECSSGTARIASVLDDISGDIIVNLQGDEPFIDLTAVRAVIEATDETAITTAIYRLGSTEELLDPSIVKVARTRQGRALYFSRSPIPFCRDNPIETWLASGSYWGHVGIYAFHRSILAQYPLLPASPLEAVERLEQLRWLEAGFAIQTVIADSCARGVDTAADLLWAQRRVAHASFNAIHDV